VVSFHNNVGKLPHLHRVGGYKVTTYQIAVELRIRVSLGVIVRVRFRVFMLPVCLQRQRSYLLIRNL